jgi:hypothetical protein
MSSVNQAVLRTTLLDDAQVGSTNGTSQWINVQGYRWITFYFKTTGNPGAGTCLIEECDYDPNTAGPGTFTASSITTVDIDVSVGTDGQYAYHLPVAAYSFLRARIGTSVTVATLDVVMVAV